MRKRVSAIMNTIKKNRKGFTIIELITAIGILAILGGSVGYAMTTSSKTYNKLSVEAQLQSEAQMVANMITELAIDSLNASNKVSSSLGMGYDETDGKILLLESALNSVKKQYVIGRKASKNEIYLAERAWDTSNKKWKDIVPNSDSLLGEYITGFTVDTSRVEEDNVLMFKLSYTKNGKTYDGNYQVLMRNRAYANKNKVQQNPKGNAKVSININPELVYINIKNDQVEGYYEKDDDLTQAPPHTLTSSGVPFTVTVSTNLGDKPGCKWELLNEDEDIFEMSSDKDTEVETINLTWDKKKKPFKDSPVDAFKLVATKTITLTDGSDTIDANPKLAQILLRRIKSISLYSLSGTTQWKPEYDTYENNGKTSIKSSEAQGYAYKGTGSLYMPINLNASIVASNIAYGGGVSWEIEMKDDAGTWVKCTNANYARLDDVDGITETSTNMTVILGSAAENGDLFRVTAKSLFDDSFKASYIFGVAPTDDGDLGYNSRGFYTSLSGYYKGQKLHNNDPVVDEVMYVSVVEVVNAQSGLDQSKLDEYFKLRYQDGGYRVYVDFDAFRYNDKQKNNFYGWPSDNSQKTPHHVELNLVIGYAVHNGDRTEYYIFGQNSSNKKADMVAKMKENFGIDITTSEIKDATGGTVYYRLEPVRVSKSSPTAETIVLKKGDAVDMSVVTKYYNLLSPRNGMYYFGAYINDMNNNLLQPGKADINPYFNLQMTSEYGDTNRYVEKASVQLTAKSLTAQKKYLTGPATVRFVASDFYFISQRPESYTDYKVLIANVEGTGVYIQGPAEDSSIAWTAAERNAIEAGTKTTITGLDTNGNNVSAKVYKKSDDKYYCEYAGRTYKYNSTFKFWQR